jgi:membrane protease YdiL (CAAX protease family)
MQYDWFFMGHIVVIGVMLGWLRWRSGSLLLTMGLHALLNAWAMLEVAVITEWLN